MPPDSEGILYAAKLHKAGVKVWDTCFAGQIYVLLGLPPDAAELKEYERTSKTAMKESY